MNVYKRYKLGICLIVFSVLNVIIFTSVAANNNTKIVSIETKQPSESKEHQQRLKFEAVLNETSAKQHLGFNIPIVTTTAFTLCDTFKNRGLTIPTLMGIIEVESNFNPMAIYRGKDGLTPLSYGLMQVTPGTGMPILSEMGYRWNAETILRPDINMKVGVIYLLWLHEQFTTIGVEGKNEFHVSLVAYNRGQKSVFDSVDKNKRKAVPLDYLAKVKIASRKWENAGF